MKHLIDGIVIDNSKIADDIFQAAIKAPEIAAVSLPGQFVNIYFPDSIRIFPRPFSVASADNDTIHLVYKVVGPQTLAMSKWKKDESIRLMGPLGNHFPEPFSDKQVILLAGGVGAAPLMFLRDRLFQARISTDFFLGARTKSELPFSNDEKSHLHIATDDGTMGHRGFITELLFSYLDKHNHPAVIYVCGPDSMMKSLKDSPVPDDAAVYVSLEKTMACGLGLCQGCIVKNASGQSKRHYALICKDGPVFNINDIEFDD